MTDVVGWSQLMTGHVVNAAFMALNVPFGGYLIFLFYMVLSLIVWTRTQSIEMVTIISLIFMSSFLVAPWFNTITFGLTGVITVFELALTIFKMFTKERNY